MSRERKFQGWRCTQAKERYLMSYRMWFLWWFLSAGVLVFGVFVVVFCWLYLLVVLLRSFFGVCWRCVCFVGCVWQAKITQILRLPPKSDQPRSPNYALATKKWQAKISLSGKVRTLLNSILYISTLFNSLSLSLYIYTLHNVSAPEVSPLNWLWYIDIFLQ